jgi:hypothetical protein
MFTSEHSALELAEKLFVRGAIALKDRAFQQTVQEV